MPELLVYNGQKWVEIRGRDGKTPVAGVDYQIPKDGKDGKDGAAADEEKITKRIEDNLPKLAESIRNSLELLQGEERLDESAVKGLTEKLKEAERDRKVYVAGGGGMRAWIHQNFSVDSSTTTITLTHAIGASGFAVMAYYNGQFLVRGTHYTMGSDAKILTLQFTPTDGTSIDVVYLIPKRML
jgi:hypothetical protein